MIQSTSKILDSYTNKMVESLSDKLLQVMAPLINAATRSEADSRKAKESAKHSAVLLAMMNLSMVKVGYIKILEASNPSPLMRQVLDDLRAELLRADPMGFNAGKIDYFDIYDTFCKFILTRASKAEDNILEIDEDILKMVSSIQNTEDAEEISKQLAVILKGSKGLKVRKDILDSADKARIMALAQSVQTLIEFLESSEED